MRSSAAPTIDFHAHTVPAAYLELVRGGEVPDARMDRDGNRDILTIHADMAAGPVAQRLPVVPGYFDPDVRLAVMDAAGVDIHVLSPIQFLYHYWVRADLAADLARVVNDGIAEMVKAAPRRLVGMATLPLQDPDATLRELDRVHALGFRAVEIGTHVAGVGLDAPTLERFYARAETLGTVVFVHPYAPLGRDRLGAYFLRNLLGNPFETAVAMGQLIFGGVLDRFPGLRLVFAHGGGAVPYVIGRLERGYTVEPGCRAAGGRSPATHLGRVYYDTITHDIQALQYLIARVGASQIVMGSDWPYSIGDLDPVTTVRKLGLDGADSTAILGANAAALLGLPK